MRVETVLHTCYLSGVRWWTKTICVLLALLWLPATTHCNLERAFDLTMLACGSSGPDQHSHSESDCDLDGCSVLEDGHFKTEDSFLVTVPDFALACLPVFLFTPSIEPDTASASPPVARSDFSLISRGWRFSQRTVLPIRAPSLYA
jgi:hypothetical protein